MGNSPVKLLDRVQIDIWLRTARDGMHSTQGKGHRFCNELNCCPGRQREKRPNHCPAGWRQTGPKGTPFIRKTVPSGRFGPRLRQGISAACACKKISECR
jgi:hypothetical protein